MAVFARQVILIFSDHSGMMKADLVLIRSQSVVLLLHVWTIIAIGLFHGTGKATCAAVMGLSRQVFSLIPCVVILSTLFGLDGLARSQATADIVSRSL